MHLIKEYKRKVLLKTGGSHYMDGLVSTGKIFSHHNIRNYFIIRKKNGKIFYSHFFYACGKG
jgi:hypothetical protein